MNEKYEIIIKEKGEEIKRVSAKGLVFTAVSEEGIHGWAKVNGISGLELALMTMANEELIDQIWKDGGIESRGLREAICKKVEQIKSSINEEAVKE